MFCRKSKRGKIRFEREGREARDAFNIFSIYFDIFQYISIYFQYIPVHFQDNVFLEENSKGRRSGLREEVGEQESATWGSNGTHSHLCLSYPDFGR